MFTLTRLEVARCGRTFAIKSKRENATPAGDRSGKILHRFLWIDRTSHIEARKQVEHLESDTVIGANYKGAIVTMVDRKSRFGVI